MCMQNCFNIGLKTVSWAIYTWLLVGTSFAADSLGMPLIEVDGAGNSIAVWDVQNCTGKGGIQGAQLPFGASQWSPLTPISDPETNAFQPKLSMNDSGNAVVAWIVTDRALGVRSLYTSMYPISEGWGRPEKLTADDENIIRFTLKIGSTNNIVVTWFSYSGSLQQETVTSRSAVFAGQWSGPMVVDTTAMPAPSLDQNQ